MKMVSESVQETFEIGATFAKQLSQGAVLSLVGELGSGKTELVKGIAHGLGHIREVTSPTFTLIHEYRGGRLPLFHLDLYRLEDERELDEIGFDEYVFGSGISAIEWANRFPRRIPTHAIQIRIELGPDDARIISW
jgi:tRNA threonylcarbamoyladenosine biosynthesis protein TsaE